MIWNVILFKSDTVVLRFEFMKNIVKFIDTIIGNKAVFFLSNFFFLVILVAATIPGLLLISHSFYRLEKAVRNTTWSFTTFIWILFRNHLVVLLPLILFFSLMPLVLDNNTLLFILTGSFFLLMGAMGPLWVRLTNHAKPLHDLQLTERIENLCKRAGIRSCATYVLFIPGGKVLNAMLSGILPFYRCIFITDTAIEQLTDEEMEAIVAHEIGHANKRHLGRSIVFSLLILLLLSIIISYLFDNFLEQLLYTLSTNSLMAIWMSENVMLTVTNITVIVCIVLSIGIFVLLNNILSRHFEKEADIFAANLTGNKKAYLSMLEKLARLNHVPKIWGKTEIHQTHPSMQKRMDYIAKT